MVDRILQYAGNRSVVLGSKEDQTVCRGDLALESRHRGRWRRVVILVIKGEIADVHLGKSNIRRSQFRNGSGQTSIDGILAKTADNESDFELWHEVSVAPA